MMVRYAKPSLQNEHKTLSTQYLQNRNGGTLVGPPVVLTSLQLRLRRLNGGSRFKRTGPCCDVDRVHFITIIPLHSAWFRLRIQVIDSCYVRFLGAMNRQQAHRHNRLELDG